MDKMSEKRIDEMVEAVIKVARGDYSVQVELSGKNDEFDSLAMGLNMMIDDVRAGFEDLDRQRKEVNALNKLLEQGITDRKRVEELYQTLANSSPVGVYIVQDGKLQFANPQFQKYTGYTEDELLGMVSLSIVHPEDRERVRENAVEMLKGNRLSPYEFRYISKGGETIWAMETVTSIHYEGKRATLGNFMDITERKQAEEALRQAEEKYRTILEEMEDAYFEVDLEGNYTFVNDAHCRTLGYSREETIGMNSRVVTFEEDYEYMLNAFSQAYETGEPIRHLSYRMVGKDGEMGWTEVSAVPMRNQQGEIIGFRGIGHNITERKRTELELQKVERLESVGTLAGGIAHDFNNILTGILGNISLAQRYVESGGKAAHRLQEAEKASLRARDLTQQLLTFTKGGEPVRRTASIRELIQDSAQFALRGSRVRCEFTLPDDLRAVEIDEGQMNQVISNLVINADEAMPEGGTLNIEARNTVIEEETTLPLPEGKYVQVTVEDHGIGISEEHLGRIFEPYFTTKQKGSGLGLATAYSIIQNHDGHISAESKLGAGTAFHIYLPASERRTPESREAAVQPAPVTRVRILVMDDEEIIRELLHEELTDIGYEVELTEDGADAIERYARARDSGQPFAALIMDLTIPGGMGGQEAIGKLLEIDPEAKVIVSSGYSTDPIMADFKEYGFSAVAAKPYSTEELEETLRGILKGKK